MMQPDGPGQVVYTNKARCRDCYRCVRVCPVKAISLNDGQAHVVSERCLSCGTCIKECPQKAKHYRNDVEKAIRLISSARRSGVSVAPSFAAFFPKWKRKRLPSALRQLGFSYVGETAIGAWHTAQESRALIEADPARSHVMTACPAAVNLVEHYRTELIANLLPVSSPMVAHGKMIKERLGAGSVTVFAGPCVAKKFEAERPENQPWIDCVITFSELEEWFERSGIRLEECEESDFDEQVPGDARYFALEGGSLRAAGMSTDIFNPALMAVSGFSAVSEAFERVKEEPGCIVEPLLCEGGCINGPCADATGSRFIRKKNLVEWLEENPGEGGADNFRSNKALFSRFDIRENEVTEAQIREVLERTGKGSEDAQLNCGACGYPTCRDKAKAVVRGLAEPEMCISFIRKLAGQRTDKIIETSPNGIVILDQQLRILHMNAAFRKFFYCTNSACGRQISYLMDPQPFMRLLAGEQKTIRVLAEHPRYNLVCHQIIYPLPEDRQYVGIFVNVTESRDSRKKLRALREKTVQQARELLEHQLRMSEDIARCLGESTARGQDLLEKLTDLAMESVENQAEEKEEDA